MKKITSMERDTCGKFGWTEDSDFVITCRAPRPCERCEGTGRVCSSCDQWHGIGVQCIDERELKECGDCKGTGKANG